MKPTSLLFFFLCLLLGLATVRAKESPAAVRDMHGKILRTDTNYYILPVDQGNGGGITLSTVGNDSCPLQVTQDDQDWSSGLPVRFRPVNVKKGVVRDSTDLNVVFNAVPACGLLPVWRLDDYDESTGQRFVTTGGMVGNPGSETLSNWFKIENNGYEYKIMYCPSVCPGCEDVLCSNLGIYWEDGVRRLALADEPLRVMFKKA